MEVKRRFDPNEGQENGQTTSETVEAGPPLCLVLPQQQQQQRQQQQQPRTMVLAPSQALGSTPELKWKTSDGEHYAKTFPAKIVIR